MAYFVFFALIVAFLSGAYATGEFATFTQEPNPVRSGGNVTITCRAEVKDDEDLQWIASDGSDITSHTDGVRNLGMQKSSTTLEVDLSIFHDRVVVCGLKDNNATLMRHQICVSWGIIRPPQDIIGDEATKAMSCLVVEDCVDSPNPWYYQNGTQVVDSSTEGITVTHKSVDGTTRVVKWELNFADLTKDVFSDYTCRTPSRNGTATLKKAGDPSPTESSTCPTPTCPTCPTLSTTPGTNEVRSTTPATSTESSAPLTPSPTPKPVEHCNSSPLDLLGIHQLVNVTYQSPDSNDTESVHIKTIGSTVNVSCITNCSSNGNLTLVDVYPLSWPGDKGAVLTVNDSGVVNISAIEKSNNSASRMLQLRASVINGTKWPKPFKCAAKVRLPDGDEFIRYGKTFSVDFTIPLNVSTVPLPGASVEVKAEEGYQISCTVTGDEAPTDNPWFYSNKTEVQNDTQAGVTVSIHTLQDTIGINSILIFTQGNGNWFGEYICSAGDGKLNATVTLIETHTSGGPDPEPTSAASSDQGTSGGPDESNEPNSTPTASPGQGSVGIAAVAVAIVVVLVLGGVVFMVYWKRHMLRDWLMEKDVVKVMKKGKRGKGYKYSKLPKDISTSMKHLE